MYIMIDADIREESVTSCMILDLADLFHIIPAMYVVLGLRNISSSRYAWTRHNRSQTVFIRTDSSDH